MHRSKYCEYDNEDNNLNTLNNKLSMISSLHFLFSFQTMLFEKKKDNDLKMVKLFLFTLVVINTSLFGIFVQRRHFSLFAKSKLLLAPSPNLQCAVNEDDRFDCHPEKHLTEKKCQRRGCCWNGENATVPCFFPATYIGYVLQESIITEHGFSLMLKRHKPSPYPDDVSKLQMDVFFETETRLRMKVSN